MLDIEFKTHKGPHRLRSNSHGYTVNSKQKTKDPVTGEDTVVWRADAYLSTLPSALKYIMDLKIRVSDATSVGELVVVLRELQKEQKALRAELESVLAG